MTLWFVSPAMTIIQFLEVRRILDRSVASFKKEEDKNRAAGISNATNAGLQHRLEAQRAMAWIDEELDRVQGMEFPPRSDSAINA